MRFRQSLPLNTNLREGLELQLAYLESLQLETLGDADQPLVCIVCFCLEDECTCRGQVLWPLPHAIAYLSSQLGR